MSRSVKGEENSRKNINSDNSRIKVISKILKILVIINLLVILFLKFFAKGVTHTSTPTVWFYISLVISIIAIILISNKNLLKRKILYGFIDIIYIVLMIVLPVYKVNGQESVVDDSKTNYTTFAGVDYIITYEDVVNYTDYYNLYGLKLRRDVE